MKIRFMSWSIPLTLLFSSGALALDETPAIKVTPLVTATSSWNGKPVVYPQGRLKSRGW